MSRRSEPKAIAAAARRKRRQRILRIARCLGFVGAVEYRHVYSQSGGAQYFIGSSVDEDSLVVYAEGIERDADPNDFSLEALIAHECGHQRLIRSRDLRAVLAKYPTEEYEEILASLVDRFYLRHFL